MDRAVPSLYNLSVFKVYQQYNAFCNRNVRNRNHETMIANNQQMLAMLPRNALDDIRKQYAVALNNGRERFHELKSYYFNIGLLHDSVYKFEAKIHQYTPDHWQSLFMSFQNLRILNLYFSCSDEILELIAEHCPHLEVLDATCGFHIEFQPPGVAPTFRLKVSDVGLQNLHRCTKLKTVFINDDLGNCRTYKPAVTHVGIRGLLIGCESLEYICCSSDVGGIIANSMEMVETLNLKSVSHSYATEESIREIIRLCPRLEDFHLSLYNHSKRQNAIAELVKCAVERKLQNLHSIYLHNVTFNVTQFETFYRNVGPNLINLTVVDNHEPTRFNELLTIAVYCPHLKELSVKAYSSATYENHQTVPRNFGQFYQLETLSIQATEKFENFRKVIKFCTENANNLKSLYFGDQDSNILMDNFFSGHVLENYELESIQTSSNYRFTKLGIEKLIDDYPKLRTLEVGCTERCDDLARRMKNRIMMSVA